jgi:hypothetical protein
MIDGPSYSGTMSDCHGVLELARAERREDSRGTEARGLGRGTMTSRSRPPMVTPIASGFGNWFTSSGSLMVQTQATR